MIAVTGCTVRSNQSRCVGVLHSESMPSPRRRMKVTAARRSLGSNRVSASAKSTSSPRARAAPTRAALHLPAQSAGHESLSTITSRGSAAAIGSSSARVRSVHRSSTKTSSSAG